MLRKGIMGGTFDPVHNGHLAIAECAYRQFHLDEILFLPAGNPPHKQKRRDGATDEQRFTMVSLAIRGCPYFTLDSEELYRGGLSYTKDTLLRLKSREPDTEFYFIIGADSLMAFDSWFHPEIICKNCILIVAARDKLDGHLIHEKMQLLKKQYQASIFLLDFQEMNISSSCLRKWRREHRSIRGFVPESVLDYIEKNDIYGEKRNNG